MTCRQVAKVLQTYLDGELDAVAAARVAEHLDACVRCGLERDTYQRIKALIAGQARDDPEALARLRAFAEGLAGGEPSEDGAPPDLS